MPTASGSSPATSTSQGGIQRRSEGSPRRCAGHSLPRWHRSGLYDAWSWRYLEHDWVAKPGTFIYEPAGEAHTLVITDYFPEPALIFFAVEGGLIYLDKAVKGGFAAYEDGFTFLELARQYYREAGLEAGELDALVR